MAQMLVVNPWVADGVTEAEERVIRTFASVADADDAAFAWVMASLPWFSDGLNVTEQRAVQSLFALRAADPAAAQRVMAFPWVRDGVTIFDQQGISLFVTAAHESGGIWLGSSQASRGYATASTFSNSERSKPCS